MSRLLVVSMIAVVTFASACTGATVAKETSTPAPMGTAPSSLPTPSGKPLVKSKTVSWPGGARARWSVTDLYRHGRMVTVALTATNLTPETLTIQSKLSSSDDEDDLSGVTLRDDKGGKRYSPATYGDDDTCLCETVPYDAANGQTRLLFATYAAPPASTTTVDVSVPQVGTFDDVPLRSAQTAAAKVSPPPGLPDPVRSVATHAPYADADIDESFPVPSKSYIVTSVYGLYRQGDWVYAQIGTSLQGQVPYALEVGPLNDLYAATSTGLHDDLGIVLVEPGKRSVYTAAEDSGGSCICPDSTEWSVGAYSTSIAVVGFKAPASKIKAMDVSMPYAGVFTDVPVKNGKPPKPDAAARLPHSRFPSVDVPPLSADDPPAKGAVVTAKAPVYSSG